MASNREIAQSLVDLLVGGITADEAGKSVIFGSAAAALHGVDLDRPINDLDVFVAAETFRHLASRFAVEHKNAEDGNLVPFIRPAGAAKIEILKTFPGVAFEEVFSRARPLDVARGLKVGSLATFGRGSSSSGGPRICATSRPSPGF